MWSFVWKVAIAVTFNQLRGSPFDVLVRRRTCAQTNLEVGGFDSVPFSSQCRVLLLVVPLLVEEVEEEEKN